MVFLPGRAGTLSRMGGAMALETLTVTKVTKLVVVSRASEHMKESFASQTTGLLSGAGFPEFTCESSACGLEIDKKICYFSRKESD